MKTSIYGAFQVYQGFQPYLMPSLLLTFDNFDLVHVLGQGRILKIAQDCCYGKNHHSVLTTVDHFISLPRDYYLYMPQHFLTLSTSGVKVDY